MQPSGTEPVTARSMLRLRTVLSVLALVLGIFGAVAFARAAADPGGGRTPEIVAAIICGLTAVIAAADLAVLRRRRAQRTG
jgi:hypothetical protein